MEKESWRTVELMMSLEMWACVAHYILPQVARRDSRGNPLDMAGAIQARIDGGSASVVQHWRWLSASVMQAGVSLLVCLMLLANAPVR
jgi:hypothetical protein